MLYHYKNIQWCHFEIPPTSKELSDGLSNFSEIKHIVLWLVMHPNFKFLLSGWTLHPLCARPKTHSLFMLYKQNFSSAQAVNGACRKLCIFLMCLSGGPWNSWVNEIQVKVVKWNSEKASLKERLNQLVCICSPFPSTSLLPI